MRHINTLLCISCFMGPVVCFAAEEKALGHGAIVILNGPSGSGKSSTQKAFQNLMMPCVWIKTGIDDLFDRVLPEISEDNMDCWMPGNPLRWLEESTDSEGNRIISLRIGEEGRKVAFAMNRAIVAFAQAGCNVVVDYIAYEQVWLDDLKQLCKDEKAYFIALRISLEELERREASRGSSPVGHARSHYRSVYGTLAYDFEADSGANTPLEIAKNIKFLLEKKSFC